MACEDSFNHVRKCYEEKYGSHMPMDAREAAQVDIAKIKALGKTIDYYF